MMILNKKNAGFLKLEVSIQTSQIKQKTIIFLKKLLALSLLVTFTIGTGACVNKKPEAQTAKTQLETLGIDANKAFFVTPSGKATNDGSSWQKAMDLQTAIDAAATNIQGKKFVLVAQGSYYADPNKTDVTKSFILKDKVKIYGGFDVNIKKLTRYKDASILEGELKAKEGTNAAINTKQILTGTNLSAISILDGFLIQNALNEDDGNDTDRPQNWIKGAAFYLNNSSPQLNNLTFNKNKLTGIYSSGGAIYNNNNSRPSISNVNFSNNYAKFGGAISNINNSKPIISNASFSNNFASYGLGGAIYNLSSSPIIINASFSKNFAAYGGAIYNKNNSSPSISNSTFNKNFAKSRGGAINNYLNSSPSISNSSFSNNSVKYRGGAIYNWSSSPNISNSSFTNNSAKYGGAINNSSSSNPSISNSDFSNNSAKYGGAIDNDKSSPKIYNSILWNNKDKHKGTEAINSIYNREEASQPKIKNSILNVNSAVTKTSSGDYPQDYKQTKIYNFMDFSKAEFSANQEPATFSIDEKGKVASANQALIKDKGDNALYKEVTKKQASEDKDLAGKPRLQGSKIDIGAYEIQQ